LGLIVAEEMGWLDGMFDEYHQKVELIQYGKRLPNGEKKKKAIMKRHKKNDKIEEWDVSDPIISH
jgi:hypothetical protein